MVSRVSLLLVLVLAVYWAPTVYFRAVHRASWESLRGDYAVVTGASYGIGREFAVQLAARGLNVVVTGRTRPKLEQLCAEVGRRFGVACRVFVQDALRANWRQAREAVAGLNVSVLVNNVGGGAADGQLRALHEFSDERHRDTLALNWHSAFGWTHLLLGHMKERRRGRIIMLSSLARLFGYHQGVYAPSKHAMEGLAIQVNNEYAPDNVRAESLLVGQVSTPALADMDTDAFGITVSSSYFVRKALDAFGFYESYAPTIGHSLINRLGEALPVTLRSKVAQMGTENLFESIRSRVNTKKEEL